MTAYSTILTSQDGRVFNITLNRPKELNPISKRVLDELADALDSVKQDDSVGVLVIKANGKAFSTGYDLREEDWITSQYPGNFEGTVDIQQDRRDIHGLVDYWMKMWRYPKPIIAQVQGDCFSGAGELLAVSDLAIASE